LLQLDFVKGSDRRRYNLPTGPNELTLIIPGDEDSCANSRDIILRSHGGHLTRITECHPAYIALHFPLLSPTGQLGWHSGIPYVFPVNKPARERRFLSFCDFAKYRVHPRPAHIESTHYFRTCLLFQELLVYCNACILFSKSFSCALIQSLSKAKL